MGGDSKDIQGFTCFAQTRDMNSATFADGSLKQLTPDHLSTFLSPAVASSGACDIDFHDVHIIGAIVSYALNQLFHGAPAVSGAQNPEQAAARMALAWISLLPSHLTSVTSAEVIMRDFLDAALTVAANDGRSLTTGQCRVVNESFPVFSGYWFSGSTPRFTCI